MTVQCRRALLPACVLCGLFLTPGLLYAAEERTIEVIGRSADGYPNAVEDALRQAVRQGAGVLISSETAVRDFVLLRDCIYSRAAGYVRSRQVIKRSREPNDLYAAHVRATVRTGKIDEDWAGLKMLLERKGRPDIMVVVSRSGEAQTSPMDITAAESVLADFFESRHFDLVDRDTLGKVVGTEQARAALWDSPSKAAAVGLRLKAGYVLVGRIRQTTGKPEEVASGVMATMARADLRVKLVAADTGKLLTTKLANVKAGSQYPEKASQDAVKKAAAALAEPVLYRLISHWSEDLDQGLKIDILLAAVDLDVIQEIAEGLRNAKEEGVWVKGVTIAEADARGISRILIWGPGVTTSWLAKKVKAVMSGKVKAVRMTPSRIEFEAVGRKPPDQQPNTNQHQLQ